MSYGGTTSYNKKRKCYEVRAKAYKDENGKTKQPYIGAYKTKKEAQQALAEYNVNPWNLSEKPTFAQLFDIWIKEKELDGLSKWTIYAYKAAFKQCLPLHNMKIRDIKYSHLQSIMNNNIYRSQPAANNIKVVMQGVCRIALANDYITKDYSSLVTPRYTVNPPKHRCLTKFEIVEVLTSERNLVNDVSRILLYTGFRINELLELTADNVDMSEWYFIGGKKTKAGKNRKVPIHKDIQPIVAEYVDQSSTQGGGVLFNIKDAEYREATTEKWGILPHDFRHTFISTLDNNGVNENTRNQLTGHKGKGVAEKIYIHKSLEELRKAIDSLDYSSYIEQKAAYSV